jgi:hypothetical protein
MSEIIVNKFVGGLQGSSRALVIYCIFNKAEISCPVIIDYNTVNHNQSNIEPYFNHMYYNTVSELNTMMKTPKVSRKNHESEYWNIKRQCYSILYIYNMIWILEFFGFESYWPCIIIFLALYWPGSVLLLEKLVTVYSELILTSTWNMTHNFCSHSTS